LGSTHLFRLGAFAIGLGGGLFSVCTLTSVMALSRDHGSGIALGAWGAVQATAMGSAVLIGGALKDAVSSFSLLGPELTRDAIGYSVVYHVEIFLLFATLVVLGPLVRHGGATSVPSSPKPFGLSAFPG
ncbi:MAG: PucC family protein, partial [Pseudomonadota bacterium]